MLKSPSLRRRGSLRKAAATVELAVCLPVLVFLVFGAIEVTSYIFLRQALQAAAYEGLRSAASRDANLASSQAAAQAVLSLRQVQGAQLRFQPADPTSAPRGTMVTLTVTAPTANNSPLGGRLVRSRDIAVQTVMLKE